MKWHHVSARPLTTPRDLAALASMGLALLAAEGCGGQPGIGPEAPAAAPITGTGVWQLDEGSYNLSQADVFGSVLVFKADGVVKEWWVMNGIQHGEPRQISKRMQAESCASWRSYIGDAFPSGAIYEVTSVESTSIQCSPTCKAPDVSKGSGSPWANGCYDVANPGAGLLVIDGGQYWAMDARISPGATATVTPRSCSYTDYKDFVCDMCRRLTNKPTTLYAVTYVRRNQVTCPEGEDAAERPGPGERR